jgi:imidazolonepropionase-like amidohydrolase
MKKIRKWIYAAILFACVTFAFPEMASAQSDNEGKSPATRTYAIKNATIIQAPGRTIEGGTILVKDGLISAIGKNINIPAGTHVINGDSLFVYAGFIDGLSQAGVLRPKDPERPRDLKPNDPPNELAGVTPERNVSEFLDPSAKSLEDMRKAGFTAAQVVPFGRMLPGNAAVILMTETKISDQMIVKPSSALYSQFTGGQGVYPSTVIGVMAKYRELYKNADLNMQHEKVYASNATGINRPTQDRTLQAFHPVINKQQSVLFNVESNLNARRALTLQKELGFNLVLANLRQGWDLESEIKRSNARVLLSLNLPEEKKVAEDKNATEEVKEREARRIDSYKQYVGLAAQYEKAGIKFGFAGIDAKPGDVKKHMRTMVANGLSENAALEALTTTPAQMLGVSNRMGTLEQGKMANLFATTGSYFDEKSEVKLVMVDGVLYEYEVRARRPANGNNAAAGNNNSASIMGKWDYKSETPQGTVTGVFQINGSPAQPEGTITMGMTGPEALPLSDIKYSGNELSFVVILSMGGQSLSMQVKGEVSGSDFSGKMNVGQFGSFNITAQKNPGQ